VIGVVRPIAAQRAEFELTIDRLSLRPVCSATTPLADTLEDWWCCRWRIDLGEQVGDGGIDRNMGGVIGAGGSAVAASVK